MASLKFKPGHYARRDNKPLSLRELKALVNSIPDTAPAIDGPVTMSSDEEGNEMLVLYGVDIDKGGNVTLWPAREYQH
jgi:hypothetical protein